MRAKNHIVFYTLGAFLYEDKDTMKLSRGLDGQPAEKRYDLSYPEFTNVT
jgi:hypothetical protein